MTEPTRQSLDDAQVFSIDEGTTGSRLAVSVFDGEAQEDFVQVFDRDRDAIISIDVSVWKRIVAAVDRRLSDKA
jgi:hypothetical protein